MRARVKEEARCGMEGVGKDAGGMEKIETGTTDGVQENVERLGELSAIYDSDIIQRVS